LLLGCEVGEALTALAAETLLPRGNKAHTDNTAASTVRETNVITLTFFIVYLSKNK
jgi:hypothetical protein